MYLINVKKHSLVDDVCFKYAIQYTIPNKRLPYGLVVRISGSHPEGPGSIPGMGSVVFFPCFFLFVYFMK